MKKGIFFLNTSLRIMIKIKYAWLNFFMALITACNTKISENNFNDLN